MKDLTVDTIALSSELIAMGGENNLPPEHVAFDELKTMRDRIVEWCQEAGLSVIEGVETDENPYPYVTVAFPDQVDLEEDRVNAKVAIVGHVDVVTPSKPDHYVPYVEGDYLFGRGSADMKTVVASSLVWMKWRNDSDKPNPPIVSMISFTEENGSPFGHNSETAKKHLEEMGADFEFAIVGERTGEMESFDKMSPEDRKQAMMLGSIRNENRGVRQYQLNLETDSSDGDFAWGVLFDGGDAFSKARHDIANQMTDPSRLSSFTNTMFSTHEPLDRKNPYQVWKISRAGESKHAAQVDPREISNVEDAQLIYGFIDSMMDDSIGLVSFHQGVDSSANTYNSGFEMTIAMHPDNGYEDMKTEFIEKFGSALDNYTPSLKELFRDLDFTNVTDNGALYEGPAHLKGTFDVREMCEHEPSIVEAIEQMKSDFLACDGALLTDRVVWGSWHTPEDNPHLQSLMAARENVTGEPSELGVKNHGSDAWFFRTHRHPDTGVWQNIAVVFGQVGFNPHGPKEKHYIPSIQPWIEVVDEFADTLCE